MLGPHFLPRNEATGGMILKGSLPWIFRSQYCGVLWYGGKILKIRRCKFSGLQGSGELSGVC